MGNVSSSKKYKDDIPGHVDLYGDDQFVNQFMGFNFSNEEELFTPKEDAIKWLLTFGNYAVTNKLVNKLSNQHTLIKDRVLVVNARRGTITFKLKIFSYFNRKTQWNSFCLVEKK